MNKVWLDKNESLHLYAEDFMGRALKFGLKVPNDFAIDNVRNSCYANKKNQATFVLGRYFFVCVYG